MDNCQTKETISLSPIYEKGNEQFRSGELGNKKLEDWTPSQKTDFDKDSDTKFHLLEKKDSSKANNGRGVSCNCKKTQCLKLYCECFAYKSHCGPLCKCEGCLNNNENEAKRLAAMEAIQMKAAVTLGSQKIQNLQMRKLKSNKGCSCKKSGCLKKYCECYSSNRKCGELCVCQACRNSSDHCHSQPVKREATSNLLQEPVGKKKLKQRFLSSEEADRKLDQYLYGLPEPYHNNFLRFLFIVLQQQ